MCDFNRVCRACKCESGDLQSVFEGSEKDGGDARIDEMLMACASVQVTQTNTQANFRSKQLF